MSAVLVASIATCGTCSRTFFRSPGDPLRCPACAGSCGRECDLCEDPAVPGLNGRCEAHAHVVAPVEVLDVEVVSAAPAADPWTLYQRAADELARVTRERDTLRDAAYAVLDDGADRQVLRDALTATEASSAGVRRG